MANNDFEFGRRLWEAADQLRANSRLRASEYSVPVLGLIFLKYIDSRFQTASEFLSGQYFAQGGPSKEAYQAQGAMYLPEEAQYAYLVDLPSANIGQALNDAMKLVEQENPALKDVLPKTYNRFENNLLVTLLSIFDSIGRDTGSDIFSEIYEYFLYNFAMAEGYHGGEFYSPPEVSRLLARLLDPCPGERICDPACGSGSLLIRCAEEVGSSDYSLFGQERNSSTWALAMMNIFLHDIRQPHIEWSDPLRHPELLDDNGGLMRFNLVVANPPFSLENWGAEVAYAERKGEGLFNRFHRGLPPKSKGDYAFISHMIETTYLDPEQNGRVGVIVPHGVLFRGGVEGTIRAELVRENLLDAVIGLPPSLFYGTGIPIAILIFKRNRTDRAVLFIDASREFEESRNQNRLREQDIERIVQAYQARQGIEGYAYLASLEDIEANDFNLNISRYIYAYELPEQATFVTEWGGPHDVFISYSRANAADMELVSNQLINAGLRIWTDENLEPGTADWESSIEGAIEGTRAVVMLLSPDAKESTWVKRELIYSHVHNKPVYPVLIRGDQQSSVPIALIDTQFTDYTEKQQAAMESLVDSVKRLAGVITVRSPYLYDLWKINAKRGWESSPLGELVTFVSPKKVIDRIENFATPGGVYPIYGPSEIVGYSNEFGLDGEYLLIGSAGRNLISRSNPIARMVSGKFLVTSSVSVAKANDGVSLEFLLYSLQITDLKPYLSGATVPRLTKGGLDGIEIAHPADFEAQLEIAECIAEQLKVINSRRDHLEKQLRILNERPIGVIHKAFTQDIG